MSEPCTLIKNVASIPVHDRQVLRQVKSYREKRQFLSVIIFSYSSIFHYLPLYRWMSLWPITRAGSVPVHALMCEGVNECIHVNVLKSDKAELFGWWVVRVYVWVMLTISFAAFFVLIHVLALLKAVCKCTLRKTNDIWVKSTPHSTLINVWKQQHRLFAQNSCPSSAFFYFLTPYGEQTELPRGLINAVKYV